VRWKPGDVVGCALDLDKTPNEIRFFLNGEDQGVAFSHVPLPVTTAEEALGNKGAEDVFEGRIGLMPCAINLLRSSAVRFVFERQDFMFDPPAHHLPLQQTSDAPTAVMEAARVGRTQAVRLLLQHGAQVERRDEKGMTALMHAAEGGIPACVSLLLKHGASVEDFDNEVGWGSSLGPRTKWGIADLSSVCVCFDTILGKMPIRH
jgi:hypothetical protein